MSKRQNTPAIPLIDRTDLTLFCHANLCPEGWLRDVADIVNIG